LQAARDALPDTAKTDDAHGLVRQFVGIRAPGAPDIPGPLAVLDGLKLQMHLAIDAHHQRNRMLGHSDRVPAAIVRHLDAQFTQGHQVDHIRSGADRLHQPQLGAGLRQFDREYRGGGHNRDGILQLRRLLGHRLGGINPDDLGGCRRKMLQSIQLLGIVRR
jgi:hypothetical protein